MRFPKGMTAVERYEAFMNIRWARDLAAIQREAILAMGHPHCRTYVRIDESQKVHLRVDYQMNAEVKFAIMGAIYV